MTLDGRGCGARSVARSSGVTRGAGAARPLGAREPRRVAVELRRRRRVRRRPGDVGLRPPVCIRTGGIDGNTLHGYRPAVVPDGRTTIVMPGATGRLRPVALELLARGLRLRVLTRTPRSAAAEALAARGAEIAFGDFDDPDSLARGARGADVLVAGGTAHRSGPGGELRAGRNLADAALAAGVRHLIYISGAGADQDSGIPVFESKLAVEAHIRSLGLPATIVAPVYF